MLVVKEITPSITTNNSNNNEDRDYDYQKSHENCQKAGWRNFMSYVGPGFLVSLAYLDPGNCIISFSTPLDLVLSRKIPNSVGGINNVLGKSSSTIYAIALLASGQSSTITGTYAGQYIMQGFLDLTMKKWIRNLLTRCIAITPSLIVSIISGSSGAGRLIIIASSFSEYAAPTVTYGPTHKETTSHKILIFQYNSSLGQAKKGIYKPGMLFDSQLLWIIFIGLIFALIIQSLAANLGVSTALILIFLQMNYMEKVRKLELLVTLLVFVMAACFFGELSYIKPPLADVFKGMFIPKLSDHGATGDAIALLGALIMPHNLFLYSALVLSRKIPNSVGGINDACRYYLIESGFALFVAFLINISVISVSGTVCSAKNLSTDNVNSCSDLTLNSASFLLKGFLDLTMKKWIRNLLTRCIAITPSLIVSIISGSSGAGRLIIIASLLIVALLPPKSNLKNTRGSFFEYVAPTVAYGPTHKETTSH
ncbi:hypothetical protein LguiB_017786 [Lonicera macranthoides]